MSRRRTRPMLTLALVATMTAPAALAVAPAAVAAPRSTATIIDGCGRVDRIEVDTKLGPNSRIELLPDGKEKAKLVVDSPSSPFYRPSEYGRWTDISKSFMLVRVFEDGHPVTLYGPSGARGTESFKLTNEDCVRPKEVTFDDQPGLSNDTYSVPSVTGVKYSAKPGTQPGKGRVVVTATPDKGYRLADDDGNALPPEETSWSYDFDGSMTVEVPAGKAPQFKAGSGKDGNSVILQNVPGVTWIVDGKPAKGGKDAVTTVKLGTATSAVVTAVSADPRLYAIEGTTSWTVSAGQGKPEYGHKRKVPTVSAPGTLAALTPTSSIVRWAAPVGSAEGATFDVSLRDVRLNRHGVRSYSAWRAWYSRTTKTSAVVVGNPGTVVEVRVRLVDKDGTEQGWSPATTVVVPFDARRNGGRAGMAWSYVANRNAIGGVTLQTTARGAAWHGYTGPASRVDLWFAVHPLGAKADIYIDGKKITQVNTRSYNGRTIPRQRLVAYRVPYGRHSVVVVNRPVGGYKVLQIDAIAAGR